MQRAAKCALRLDLSRAFCLSRSGTVLSVMQKSLPPPRDEEEKAMLDSMLRVDHAGEYGANRIYAGQMAVLGRTRTGPLIQYMWDQEKMHLEKFNEILGEHRVRPTLLLPLWNIAGFALGMILTRIEGTMSCTVAVEESISEHYNSQIQTLMEAEPERYTEWISIMLLKNFVMMKKKNRDTGLEHDAESVPGYLLLKTVIQVDCKAAIYILQRI
uniref:5-demethoxyubiquinone hydroxylase, mitochondrial n=1 Tax=Cyprinus carpio TaxID=7962 RepID=A0A8C2J4J1_CYPCA